MKYLRIIAFIITVNFFGTQSFGQAAQKSPVKKPVKKVMAKKPIAAVAKKAIEPVVIDTSIRIKITTEFGVMILKLSDKTPLHRDNFVKLASSHFYDSLIFHRVINGFMIQGGDPNSKTSPTGEMLGAGDIGYTIPAEFDSTLFHKKGALCAARTNNPEKASSGCQFYIVQGRLSSDAELDNISRGTGVYYSKAKRMTYKVKGGTPFLDMNYTVFGEIESGFEVIDKIASVPKDGRDRPLDNVRMFVEVLGRENQKQ